MSQSAAPNPTNVQVAALSLASAMVGQRIAAAAIGELGVMVDEIGYTLPPELRKQLMEQIRIARAAVKRFSDVAAEGADQLAERIGG